MSCLNYLIAADRVVIAGLTAYDEFNARELARLRAALERTGHSAEEIESELAEWTERLRAGRGRLHRELWTKALALIASEGGSEG